MALLATVLLDYDADSGTSPATSIDPVDGSLVLVLIHYRYVGGGAGTGSLTGCGASWEVVDFAQDGLGLENQVIFRAQGTFTAGALTFTGAPSAQALALHVVQYTGIVSGNNGANAIAQFNHGHVNTGTGPDQLTVTLGIPPANSLPATAGQTTGEVGASRDHVGIVVEIRGDIADNAVLWWGNADINSTSFNAGTRLHPLPGANPILVDNAHSSGFTTRVSLAHHAIAAPGGGYGWGIPLVSHN